MDVTGQAFEDMQEQNIRLMQQLREKDDANFKLMSERIKSNQIHKLLKEEKEELADQVLTLKTQVTRMKKAFQNPVEIGCFLHEDTSKENDYCGIFCNRKNSPKLMYMIWVLVNKLYIPTEEYSAAV